DLVRDAAGERAHGRQLLGFGPQLVGAATVGDVGAGAEPPGDGAVRSANRQGAGEEPAVAAVPAAEGVGRLPRLAAGDALPEALFDLRHVIGVVVLAPVRDAVGRGTGVLEPALVAPVALPGGVGHPGELGN